jgi:hypothetical protein
LPPWEQGLTDNGINADIENKIIFPHGGRHVAMITAQRDVNWYACAMQKKVIEKAKKICSIWQPCFKHNAATSDSILSQNYDSYLRAKWRSCSSRGVIFGTAQNPTAVMIDAAAAAASSAW